MNWPDWLQPTLITALSAGLVAYVSKWVSNKATALQLIQADHQREVDVLKTQIDGMEKEMARMAADLKDLRAQIGPKDAGIRVRDDYIATLRHDWPAGTPIPQWPRELRES